MPVLRDVVGALAIVSALVTGLRIKKLMDKHHNHYWHVDVEWREGVEERLRKLEDKK